MSYAETLHRMEPVEINALAVRKLCALMNHSSLNLITKLTGISRTTLYRWLDESINYDDMNHRDAAWFILMCETKPQIELLLQRAPSRVHLAHRVVEEYEAEQ